MNLNFNSDDLAITIGEPIDEFSQLEYIRELLDRLADVPGDEKWLQVSHGHIVSFLAFDPAVLAANQERQTQPQIQVWAHHRVSRIQYLLPRENWPWQVAEAFAYDMEQLIELVSDAFSRCESRREHLVVLDNGG